MRKLNEHSKSKFLLILILIIAIKISAFAQTQRPNIVFIMADDFGFECIGANGGTSYNTPNIDAMASRGIRFENCHAQPICTPTRVKLMTGMYNLRNYTAFGKLGEDQVCFANLFKAAGYKTVIAGKWQLGKGSDLPQHFGFDESCLWQHTLPRTDDAGHDTRYPNPILEYNGVPKTFSNGEYGSELTSDFICDFIEENKDEPFFAYYPMLLTHCPFAPTPDSEDWDPQDQGSLSYTGEKKYFPDMVSYMDKMVGKIISKVDELGLSENTLIIFTGDNGTDGIVSQFRGESYNGGKGSTKDNGTHVPLIAYWDGKIVANSECDDLIDFSDFFPTFCEVGNIPIPSEISPDGVSFLPQLLGETGNPKEYLYCWYSKSGNLDKLKQFTRNKTYKLYASGEFYNVKNDFNEKNPIPLGNLTTEEEQAYNVLSEALTNITKPILTDNFATNCGGISFVSDIGVNYRSDKYFNGGVTYSNTKEISGTDNDVLHNSNRNGDSFGYNIPMENGVYTVSLLFSETFLSSSGKRVFNIDIEGNQVGSLDIFDEVGMNAEHIETHIVNLSDEQLDISLNAVIGKAKINAIKVMKFDGSFIPVTGVSIGDCPAGNLTIGNNQQLSATVSPDTATNKTLSWSSSNTSVAAVNSTGLVTALDGGNVSITVNTTDGDYVDNCVLNIIVPVTGISISGCPDDDLAVNGSVQLSAAIEPANATEQGLSWNSSAPSIATVDDSGLVSAVDVGEVTISVTTVDGESIDNCNLVVVAAPIPVTGVTLNSCPGDSLIVGDTVQLSATVEPADAADHTVSWGTSDLNVATVSESGFLTALSKGSADITVTTNNGAFTSTCLLTVVNLTSVSQAAIKNINIYPNPATKHLHIDIPDAEGLVEIRLFDANGQLIYKEQTISGHASIAVEALNIKGLITVKVSQGTKVSMMKVIVQ